MVAKVKRVKRVYQPSLYFDDGINVEYKELRGVDSNTYFEDVDEIFEYAESNGYDIDDVVVFEYPITDLDPEFDRIIDAKGGEIKY